MRIVIFGSTGMVGQAAMRACLLDDTVTEIVTVGRSATGRSEPKVREIVHRDFMDFSGLAVGADACLWCLGVTSAGMAEADYARITHDFTMAAARVLARPTMTFVFVSGTGADGDAMWARVKRRTEEDLATLPFKAVYVFRPGVIQPLDGIRSRTRMYNLLYPLLYPVMILAKLIIPERVTDTDRIGRAMVRVASRGFSKRILENPDINAASRA